MGVLYSLYDALVSINVPNDKARAVVDAMELDMLDKLATKAELAHTRELLSKDIKTLEEKLSAAILAASRESQLLMDGKLVDLKHSMTVSLGKLMAGMMGIATALIGAVQYFL